MGEPRRWRVTVRGPNVELRGWVDGTSALFDLADMAGQQGAIVAHSPADDDYDPFTRWSEGDAETI